MKRKNSKAMIHWQTLVRWIHILAGAAWLGEVITINFVLVPALSRMAFNERKRFVSTVFPRVFRLASILSVVTVTAGIALNYAVTGWRRLDLYLASPRGVAILAGGLLGLLLTAFHFLAESRLEARVASLELAASSDELAAITGYLRTIPRVGLGVMVTIFVLMMLGARGG